MLKHIAIKHVNDTNILNGSSSYSSVSTRLPPGLAAFVNDAHRANNHYSLKSLISNSNYKNTTNGDSSSAATASVSSRTSIATASTQESSSVDNNNKYVEIESLTARIEELEGERLRLESELFDELKKKYALVVDDDDIKKEEKKKNELNNGLFVAMREIMNRMTDNLLTEDDIIAFIEYYSQDFCWKSFDKLQRKKAFARRMRDYFCDHDDNKHIFLSYGRINKIWHAMNKMYIVSHIDWKQQQMIVSAAARDRSLIYISESVTKEAIANRAIFEEFGTSKQLFHYLRWTIKMQQIDGYFVVFRAHNCSKNELVLFNIELHANNEHQSDLYIVGEENDKITPKSPRWKMTQFMTEREIFNRYRIKYSQLPLASRQNCGAFKRFINEKERRFVILSGYIRQQEIMDVNLQNRIIMTCYAYFDPFVNNAYDNNIVINKNIACDVYCKLPQIKTQQKKENHKKHPKEMLLCWTSFYQYICGAIVRNQVEGNLISIVSFDKHKTAYFIDKLLPIKLADNHWCGIIFRDKEPLSICIDCTDIKTKSKLYDAAQNQMQFEWMQNDITRLTLIQMLSLPAAVASHHHMHNNNKNRYHHNNYKHRLVLKQAMMYR